MCSSNNHLQNHGVLARQHWQLTYLQHHTTKYFFYKHDTCNAFYFLDSFASFSFLTASCFKNVLTNVLKVKTVQSLIVTWLLYYKLLES